MDLKFRAIYLLLTLTPICQMVTAKITRPLPAVVNEVNEIRERLVNISENGTPHWEPSITDEFALKPDEHFHFGVMPERSETRSLLGRPPSNRIIPRKPYQWTTPKETDPLPSHYNAADAWGRSCPSLKHVTYQGKCGNCWAVATTAMINDRVCMYKKRSDPQRFFSAKQLTSCLAKGCDGGWFSDSLEYWITDGLVEGGDYRMRQPGGCIPYPANTAEMKGSYCETTCDDGTKINDELKSFGGAKYEIISRDPEEIMREIYFYGPVIATFDVYDDFAHYYRRGVYRRVSKKKLGGHAAKLYGWGVENGAPFWYASNSWGKNWGDGGHFKILRGVNECNIESFIHAAVPLEGLKK